MKPIIILKSLVAGYTRRDGVFVKPHSDKRTKRAELADGQLALFPAPEKKPVPPSPFKGLDPVKATPDLFADPALDPARIEAMAQGHRKAAEHEARVREADAPRREAAYQRALERTPQFETLDGVEILRVPGSKYAAFPVTGKRGARTWQTFKVDTREPVAQVRKDELSAWLARMAQSEE